MTDMTLIREPRNPISTAAYTARWRALAVLLIAAAMDLIGMTVATMALPSIAEDLGAGPAALEWVIAGYGVTFALLLITGGRLGDVLGRRRVFLLGLTGFTAASVACGLAPTVVILVIARLIQGAFAALMIPQVLSTISATFPVQERAKAFGLFGATAGISTVAGPLLGGVLLETATLGWRSIFLINVPLGVCAVIAARRWVVETRDADPARLDLVGVGLCTVALALLLIPLVEGSQRGWPPGMMVMLASAPAALGMFVAHQRRREQNHASTLVPPALFRRRSFVVGSLAALAFFSGPPSLLFVMANGLQAIGFSPTQTAVAFIPLSLASVPTAVVAVRLMRRLGVWVPLCGALIVTAGIATVVAAIGHSGADTSGWDLLPGLSVAGMGLGLVSPTLIDIVLQDVQDLDTGAASGVLNTVMQIAGATGIALAGLVYYRALPPAQTASTSDAWSTALTHGLWFVFAVTAFSTLCIALLPRQKTEH